MRGRIGMVACAIASGAVASILFLGTKAPFGRVVRAASAVDNDRVLDDPDAWRDDLWKIADDLRESSERRDQAAEEMLDRKSAELKTNSAFQEARLGEEIAAIATKEYLDGIVPQRKEELRHAIDTAVAELKVGEGLLEEAEKKAKSSPDSNLAALERNGARYNLDNAKFNLAKAKNAASVFENYEIKKEIAARKAVEQQAKTKTLQAKEELSIAEEKSKSAVRRLKKIMGAFAHEARANAALTKALDLERKWRAARDAKQQSADLPSLERAAKAAAVEARTLWRDAKITIARELRNKDDS